MTNSAPATIGDGASVTRRLARGLVLAAAPTFAIMAVLTAGTGPDVMCGGQGAALGGMAPMYVLMSAFHSAAWLRWGAERLARLSPAPSFETRAEARSSG